MRERQLAANTGVIAALAAVTLVAVGCGSSSSSSSAGAQKSAAPAPHGKPILLYNITDKIPGASQTFDEIGGAAQGAVDYVNAHGGIGGRPLRLKTCDSQNDPGATTACSQGAVASPAVVELGIAQLYGPTSAALLRRAHLPTMDIPDTPQDYSDSNAFPLGAGTFSEFDTMGSYAAHVLHAQHLSIIAPDIPTGREFAARMKAGAESGGAVVDRTVYYSLTAADDTPVVQKAIGGYKGNGYIVMSGALPVFRALYQAGFPMSHVIEEGYGFDYKNFLQPGGEALKGAYFISEPTPWSNTDDPEVQLYLSTMKQYQPQVDPRAEFAAWSFANVMTLADIFKKIGAANVSRSSVYKFVQSGVGIDPFMFPHMNSKAEGYYAPGIRNVSLNILQWQGSSVHTVSRTYLAPSLKVQKSTP